MNVVREWEPIYFLVLAVEDEIINTFEEYSIAATHQNAGNEFDSVRDLALVNVFDQNVPLGESQSVQPENVEGDDSLGLFVVFFARVVFFLEVQ